MLDRPPTLPGVGLSLRLGFPLTSADPVSPLPPQYCAACGIDVLTNPGTRIASLEEPEALDPHIRVWCDCGAPITLPLGWFV